VLNGFVLCLLVVNTIGNNKFWEECHLKDNVLSDVQNARKFMRRIIEENKLMTDRVEILKKYFNSEGVER